MKFLFLSLGEEDLKPFLWVVYKLKGVTKRKLSLLRVFSPRNLVSAPQTGLKTLFAFTLKFLSEKLKLSGALWVSQAQ